MKKIHCVIVDDEPVAREILESYILKIPNLVLVKSCKNAMEAFQVSTTETIDLFFLDIHMPEVSGLSFAKSINKNAKIIFTTAHREYAIDGFNLYAVDYLLKPISFDRFLQAVKRFFEISDVKLTSTKEKISQSSFIFIRADRKMIKIIFDDILYIESLSDYIKICLKDKIITTRETISNIETKLTNPHFLRVHRSYIVNISKIDAYTNEFIEIHKKAIPISRSYKENVLTILSKI